MKAMHAMTRDVVCIHANDRLETAADLMREWEIHHLPVVDGEKLVGLITDRDILLRTTLDCEGRCVVENCDVSHAMIGTPTTCDPGDSIESIANTMLQNKIDCVPVVSSDGKLIGLVTSVDLIELLRKGLGQDASRTVPWSYQIRLRDSSGYGKYHIE